MVILLGLVWFEFGYRNQPQQSKDTGTPVLTHTEPQRNNAKQLVRKNEDEPPTLVAAEYSCLINEPSLPQGQQYRLDIKPKEYNNEFALELHSRVKRLITRYQEFVGTQKMRKLDLSLFFLSPTQFDDFLTSRGLSGASYQGIYYPGGNIAFVKVVNKEQAIKTATHEIIHAINAQLFGRGFSRFLNEGLAEYFEHYSFSNGRQEDIKKFNVLDYWSRQTAHNELLDFYTLINSEQDWHTSNNLSLYFSGALWTQFLMSKPQGLKAMSKLLKAKAYSPCRSMIADDIVDAFVENYPDFEQDFYYFFDELISEIGPE